DERRFVRRSFRADFVQFPAADKRGGIGGLSQLKDGSRNFRAGTTRQFNQFGKGLAARLARGHAGKARRTLPPHAHKQGALRSRDGMRCYRHGSRLGVTIRLCAFLGECIRNRIIHSSCGPRDYVPPLETLEIRGTGKPFDTGLFAKPGELTPGIASRSSLDDLAGLLERQLVSQNGASFAVADEIKRFCVFVKTPSEQTLDFPQPSLIEHGGRSRMDSLIKVFAWGY